MNRLNIQTAVWLDATINTLRELREDANRLSQCRFELGAEISKDVYANVRHILNDTINKVKAEFEKL